MSVADLEKAHQPFSRLSELSAELRAAYPDRHPGYHQIVLEGGNVELLLLFGEAEKMLRGLMASVDAWYLDGFAPARNPEIWSPAVFEAIARKSRKGTRLATYTSARQVRDGLQAVGFEWNKVPGFANKRESLTAVKLADTPGPSSAPWYRRPEPLPSHSRVAVIGAGIAGACMARALVSAGAEVTLVDRHSGPSGEASGNPAGLIQPRPGGGNPAYEDLQTSAYLTAIRAYDHLHQKTPVWHKNRGLLSFARDEAFLQRHRVWLANNGVPTGHGLEADAEIVNDIAGVPIDAAGLWFPQAGTLDPGAICRALVEGVTAIYGKDISRLRQTSRGWDIRCTDDRSLLEVDCVVLANGFAAASLCPQAELPLYAKRGQISYLEASDRSRTLKTSLSYGGYATPAMDMDGVEAHILGATYQQWPDHASSEFRTIRDADHLENRSHIRARIPNLEDVFSDTVLGGRATLRTTTTDHLPLVGPVADAAAYRRDYADLRHGKPASRYPQADYIPGLYILTALGSRGFALAPLLARLLVAEMTGSPLPVDETVHNLVHPARFLVRELKRGYVTTTR